MVSYICKRCGYNTKIRTHFRSHLFRKFICQPKLENLDILVMRNEFIKGDNSATRGSNEKKHICLHCRKYFTTCSNLKRHQRTWCKSGNGGEIQITNNNLYSHNSNNTNNITNNFILSVYGKEDYSYIAQDFLKSLQSNPFEGIPRLVGLIHFNPKHPENNNVKWININKNSIQRYEKKGWTSYEKKDVIRDLNDQAYFAVDSEYDPNTTDLNDIQKKHYEKFREDYDNGNEKTIRRLEKQTERMILDERNKTR